MNRFRIAAAVAAAAALLGAALWWRGCGRSREEERAGGAAPAGAAAALQGRARRGDVRRLPRASIEGTVRDPGGAPIAGARVCAFASSSELSGEETRDPRCALAGAGGRYRLADLVPAGYDVHASAAGRRPGRYRPAGGEDDRESPIRLAAGEARRGIDLVLKPGGVEVTGVVVDIGGGTVAGAWVSASAGDRFAGRGETALVESDAAGAFTLWAAPGALQLSARADGYAEGWKSAIAPGMRVEILLTPESVLAGRVIELGTGAPVPGALVAASDGWRSWSGGEGSALTDAAGRFRITRLLPGRYTPTATAAGRHGQARESVLVGLGQTVDDIVVEVHPAAVVTGVVSVDGGGPCPAGWVGLRDPRGGEETGGRIEEAGAVVIKAVFPGTYRVEVSCDGFLEKKEYPELVVAAGSDPPPQSWTVARGARIRGRVRSAAGDPVAGAEVSARSAGGDPRGQRSWGWDASEEDGSFAIEGLVAGRYKVAAESDRFPEPVEPAQVEVADGGEATVDIVLEPAGAIAGEVVDERGRPVGGVQVTASGARWDWKQTLTRDDGTFALEGVRPGKQRVIAMRERGWGDALRAPGSSDDDDQGQKVVVAPGATARVRLVVESQDGVIRGRVVDAAGAPVTDAFIDAERESDSAAARPGGAARSMRWSWARSPVLTDTDGRFAIEKLSPGTYTVRAFRRGGGESTAEGIAVGGRVTLTIRPTGSISGTVVSATSGAPPARFTVTLTDDRRGFARSESFFRTGGAFVLRDLPAGDFDLAASAADGAGEIEVALAEGQAVSGQTIRLEGRATVTGRVVALDTGKPLAGFRMMVSPVVAGGGFSYRTGDGDGRHISGPDGRFEVADAPAGRVMIGGFPVDWDAGYGFVRRLATVASGRTTDVGEVRVAPMRQKRGERSGDLGFVLKETPPDVEPEEVVLEVALVRPPAARAGLRVGDVITSVDGHDVTGADHYLYGSLTRVAPGTAVRLGLARGAEVELTAGEPR